MDRLCCAVLLSLLSCLWVRLLSLGRSRCEVSRPYAEGIVLIALGPRSSSRTPTIAVDMVTCFGMAGCSGWSPEASGQGWKVTVDRPDTLVLCWRLWPSGPFML